MARRQNPNIKKANTEVEYTPEQINELRKCASDPVYFIKTYVRIQHPVKGSIPFELYEYQENMIRAYQNNRYTIILSARQTGKALSLDTKIPTPTGWTTMGEVSVGDYVMGGDGNPTKVTFATETMFNHSCFRVNFSNGESIIADAEHLWEVNDGFTGNTVVKTTQQMVSDGNGPRPDGKTCRYSVNNTKPLNLPEQEVDVDPYVLGTWLGDGTSSRGEFTVEQNDLEIYNTHRLLYESCDLRLTKSRPHIIRVCIRELNSKLKRLNLINNKHIPAQYLRASINQRISLLQGLMDTDGTVDKNRGGCELSLTNDKLASDAYELICSLGLKPTMFKRLKSGFVTNSIIFTPYRDDFDVFRMERKLNRQKQSPSKTRQLSTKRRSILSIEPVNSVPVRCITVDNEDHLFLAGEGMIPTHNSTVAIAFLLWYTIFNFDKTVLIVSNKNAGSIEMIGRIKYAYENLPYWLKPGVQEDTYSKHAVGWDNQSRIVAEATSETSGRGLSISLLYCDELAFVSPEIQEEFWTSIQPTLSTGGSCIVTSTPNGDSDLYATLWRGALVQANSFHPIQVRWDDPPDRDEQFKTEEMGNIGERRWNQEYECCCGATAVTVQDEFGNEKLLDIEELYDMIMKDLPLV